MKEILKSIAGIDYCQTIKETEEYEAYLIKTKTVSYFSKFQGLFSRPTIFMIVSRDKNCTMITCVCGKEEVSTNATHVLDVIKDVSFRWGELELRYTENGCSKDKCNPFRRNLYYPEYFDSNHIAIIRDIEQKLGLKEAVFD